MKMKENMGWQRAGRIAREWAILGGLMIGLHLMVFAGWIVLEPVLERLTTTSFVLMGLLTVFYLIGLAAILVVTLRRMARVDSPPEYRYARTNGLPASAMVLDIEWTGFQSRQRSVSFVFWPTKREYQMRLRVTRRGQADYEVQVAEYLTTDQTPEKGATVAVKVHPERPEIVVLEKESGK